MRWCALTHAQILKAFYQGKLAMPLIIQDIRHGTLCQLYMPLVFKNKYLKLWIENHETLIFRDSAPWSVMQRLVI